MTNNIELEKIVIEMEELGIKPITDAQLAEMKDELKKRKDQQMHAFFSSTAQEFIKDFQTLQAYIHTASECWKEGNKITALLHLESALRLTESKARGLRHYCDTMKETI